MPSSSQMWTYIYCIVHAAPFEDEQAPFHERAIGGPQFPARLLPYDDLAAVVSDVPARRLDIKREYLLAHEAVILEAMERSEVIPLSFGTLAQNDEEVVKKLLEPAIDELREQLAAIQGCDALDLKVLWNQEQLFAEIVAEDERIRALRRAMAGASINGRIELGQLTSEAIARKSEQETQLLLDELEPLAVEVRLNRQLSDMMLMNAAFLVEKRQLDTFDSAVKTLTAAQEGRLLFRYAGPVPPYHFVDLSLHWGDANGSA